MIAIINTYNKPHKCICLMQLKQNSIIQTSFLGLNELETATYNDYHQNEIELKFKYLQNHLNFKEFYQQRTKPQDTTFPPIDTNCIQQQLNFNLNHKYSNSYQSHSIAGSYGQQFRPSNTLESIPCPNNYIPTSDFLFIFNNITHLQKINPKFFSNNKWLKENIENKLKILSVTLPNSEQRTIPNINNSFSIQYIILPISKYLPNNKTI